jgi:hypothetical protein
MATIYLLDTGPPRSARVSRPRRSARPQVSHSAVGRIGCSSWNATASTPNGVLFHVTFSVVDWLPIFVSETPCKIVTESLDFCHRQKGLRVNAYVIMPTHLHAILFHADFQAKALEQVVTDLRKFTGRKLADFCAQHMPASFKNVLLERAGSDRERRFVATHAPPGANRDGTFLASEDRLPAPKPRAQGPRESSRALAILVDELLGVGWKNG